VEVDDAAAEDFELFFGGAHALPLSAKRPGSQAPRRVSRGAAGTGPRRTLGATTGPSATPRTAWGTRKHGRVLVARPDRPQSVPGEG
jgi:hypothetical protein